MIVRASSLSLTLIFALTGCGAPQLVPTPNLYVDSEENPFAAVPAPFRTNEIDVLYVTDRRLVPLEDGTLEYDHGRSFSLAFGSATVSLGDDVSWESLVKASRTHDRDVSLPVTVSRIEETGRFPATPFPLVKGSEADENARGYRRLGLVQDPVVIARHEEVAEALRQELRQRLANTPRKEAFIYIHGYNNSFDDAVSVIAQVWHFLGRIGVPIAYTWPAGIGGIRGYLYDRESGEFTIFHLKQFLHVLTSCEELEKVHFIAHSRGTDVMMTAIRELWIEMRGQIRDPGRKRKLGHIIIAAPDLDIEVISQRIAAEEIGEEIDRLTIYMSSSDAAIGLSTWMFRSKKRIGRLQSLDEIPEPQRQRAKLTTGIGTLVDARVDSGWIGHSYFFSHPAVLSDVILILRDGLSPGKENGRPLERGKDSFFWRIVEDYPRQDTGLID